MAVKYEDLLGKSFVMGGDGIEGFDCYTLSREVCERVGIKLPEKQSILDLEARSEAINVGKNEDYIRLEKPEPYCIVTFKIVPPFVTHMGVVLEDKRHFIHVMKKRLVCVEKLNHKYWQQKMEGFYRYAGNSNGNN